MPVRPEPSVPLAAADDAGLVLFRARALLREALERDIDTATLDVFGFAGARCDRIVAGVLARAGRSIPDAQRIART